MKKFLQKEKDNGKNHGISNQSLMLKLYCMMIIAFILSCLPMDNIQAATGIKLYNYSTKKTTTYTDKQVKVTLNGKKISLDNAPGILVNGIALVPYDTIFENSAIGADCSYNDKKGTITITKNDKTIVMTVNSKKATLNNKSVTLPVAPMKIKYNNSGTARILVPSRFVSETFGFGYTWNSSTSTVAITKNSILVSFNSGNKFDYTGTKGYVTLDGSKIDLGNMPSIITNNTAMLRAKRVFSDSSISAAYAYDSKSKKITLTKDDTILVMTVGSKTAYLNEQSIKLDTAPMIIKNYECNTSYVMVPGSFTAISLGYDYIWNKDTSIITTKSLTENPAPDNSGNPPADNAVIKEYQASGDLLSTGSGQKEIKSSDVTSGFISMAVRDYSNTKKNVETYAVYSTVPFGNITSSNTDHTITVQAANMSCSDQVYQMIGSSGNYVNTISTKYDYNQSGTVISLDVLPSDYSYDITLSDNKQVLYVSVYVNSLTSLTIGTNAAGDTFTMAGLSPLNVTMDQQSNYVFIDLPYTVNGIGDQSTGVINGKYIRQCYISGLNDRTQIILEMNTGYKAVTAANGNQYTISFQADKEIPQEQPPVNIDKSKYEIVIPKPSDVTISKITDEDDYFNNRFLIKLPGNYTSFYSGNKITWNSKVVKDAAVSYKNGETQIIITTTKLQGYTYTADNENIYVHIGDPRSIYKNIVVLDPGHGGPAPGAQYFGTKEKDVNLKILYEVGKKYFYSDPSKLKVYYTRTTDVDMSLYDRADFAAKVGADLFVSLHMNASTSASPYGTEVYYYSDNKAKLNGMTSYNFASIMLKNLCGELGSYNRGAKSEKYVVVYKNSVPAILIELGFLSNKNDHAKLTDAAYQDKAVKEIYDTLLEVFEKYPTGR